MKTEDGARSDVDLTSSYSGPPPYRVNSARMISENDRSGNSPRLSRVDEWEDALHSNPIPDIVNVDPNVVDRLLSDELNQLSLLHRERVLEEIHGINTNCDQRTRGQPEDDVLKEYQAELDRIYFSELAKSEKNNSEFKYPAYKIAREEGSELIQDRDFMMTFFGQGEGNDCPKKGAVRMLNYLELVREIYDVDDVLFRPICLADFDQALGSKDFMYENGPLQVLPVRDPSGRRVFVHLRDFGPSSCLGKVRSQVGMYFAQTILEDRDGAVFVIFLHQAHNNVYNTEEFKIVNRLLLTIPPKFSAVHICCPDGRLYDIARAAVTLLLGKKNRERLRFHIGSYQECKYALRPFGIPDARLPIDLDFQGSKAQRRQYEYLRNHQRWLRIREAKENIVFTAIGRDANGMIIDPDMRDKSIGESFAGVMAAVRHTRSKFIECPRHEDCLFGKGRPAMYHPGNVAMRRLIEEKIDRFQAMDIRKKSDVVWEVVTEIKNFTGRFLREENDHAGAFVIADDETAFKKIASGFRDLKKKRRRLQDDDSKTEIIPSANDAGDYSQQSVRGKKRPATVVANSLGIYDNDHIPNEFEAKIGNPRNMMTFNSERLNCFHGDVATRETEICHNIGCPCSFF